MPTIQSGVVTMDMQWFAGILLGIIGFGGAAFGFLLKYALGLHQEQATLKAKISVLEESSSDFKKDSKEEIADLKAENLQLQKMIQEKCSDDAVLAKYEIKSDMGFAIHKQSKLPYCLGCLTGIPRKEAPLVDSGNWWLCSVEGNKHHMPEKQSGRNRHISSDEINDFLS